MTVLVTPPWDLCGGPGFDYDDPFDLWGVRRSKPRPDPNRDDGRWGELAFMPHSTIPFGLIEGEDEHGSAVARTVFVPAYPSLSHALTLEAIAHRMMRFEQRVLTVHERVACPKCGARVGERCVAWRSLGGEGVRRETKHPHHERLRADGIW